MFKNAIFFRIADGFVMPPVAALEEALGLARFAPLGATQVETCGWVEPRGEKHGALVEVVGGEFIFKLMGESKSVPGSVVKDKLAEKCEAIEKETGRKPGSKQKKELKEEIVQALLPHAFPKKGATLMWVSPKQRLLVVDAGSIKKTDGITSRFIEALSQIGCSIDLSLMQTQTSAATGMAKWLVEREAPAGFSVDRECELKQPDTEKSTVRYSRHSLEIDEVAEHIKQGKVPTKLAMTWEGRVSFVLGDDLTIKKVALLDVVLESREESGFDTDVAIVTGELSKLIPGLIVALDGEWKSGDGAAGDQQAVCEPSEAANAPAAEQSLAGTAPWEVQESDAGAPALA